MLTKAGLRSIVTFIVNFVVRRTLPSGTVTADDALWLTSALDLSGPTETTINIAYLILDRAEHVGYRDPRLHHAMPPAGAACRNSPPEGRARLRATVALSERLDLK